MLAGRSILVTGGAGFIGSNLVDELLVDNHVTVVDNFSSGKLENLSNAMENPAFDLQKGDLLDSGLLDDVMHGVDMVFHLAANPDVKMGSENTNTHLKQNLVATHNVLEAMRREGVSKIAFTSTSTVYGEALVVPTPENYAPLKPISLYGASKLACEAFISSYCHTFDMQSWIYRFANIVGKRGGHGVLVDFIKKLRENPSELEILGSGTQSKSYLCVDDCVDAMLHCVEKADDQVNIFNIGSKDYIDVKTIADIVVQRMGLSDVKYRYTGGIDGRGWKGDVKMMLLSTSALEDIGWIPQSGSKEAVAKAVDDLLNE